MAYDVLVEQIPDFIQRDGNLVQGFGARGYG
jgi:hypothetical protein